MHSGVAALACGAAWVWGRKWLSVANNWRKSNPVMEL